MRQGFTILELILVIGLLALLVLTSTPFLSQFLLRHYHRSAVNQITNAVYEAQTSAQTNKLDTPWGICLVDAKVYLYAGDSCASATFRRPIDLSPQITVSGLSDVRFDMQGKPSVAQTIWLSSNLASSTVTMTAAGGVDVE